MYCYLEEELGMSIITSKRTFTVELATPQDRQWLDLGEYNCLAVVANQVYNSEGIIPIPAASAFRITRYAARRNPDHDKISLPLRSRAEAGIFLSEKRRCHFRHRLL